MSALADSAALAAFILGVVNTAMLVDTRAAVTRLAARYLVDGR